MTHAYLRLKLPPAMPKLARRDESGPARAVPVDFTVACFPNPFTNAVTIRYTIPHDARVLLKVYSPLGRELATLADGPESAGAHTEVFTPGSHFPSGLYFYRIFSGDEQHVGKMRYAK